MSWLARMKQKPDGEKKVIAFVIAIITTAVIAALWIIAHFAVQK
jgi:heme/copper-type cytochrome/quinol oxidase subunit 4